MDGLNACALNGPKRAKLAISQRSVPKDAPTRSSLNTGAVPRPPDHTSSVA